MPNPRYNKQVAQPRGSYGWETKANNVYPGDSTEVGAYDKSGRTGAPAHGQKGEAPKMASLNERNESRGTKPPKSKGGKFNVQ